MALNYQGVGDCILSSDKDTSQTKSVQPDSYEFPPLNRKARKSLPQLRPDCQILKVANYSIFQLGTSRPLARAALRPLLNCPDSPDFSTSLIFAFA